VAQDIERGQPPNASAILTDVLAKLAIE